MLCRYARTLALSLLASIAAHAANVQIRDLPATIVLPASNEYFIADGVTQGTGKVAMANFPQVVTTRTALAALAVVNVPTGVTVQTLGGSALGDSQGSLYYYSSTSTATANGVTIISPGSGVGRWLIVFSNSLPAPTTTTLGGVFSKAAVLHQYVTQIGTDGVITTGTVSTSDVTGLGTMATQAANAVAITGGTISGLSSPLPVASGGTGGNDPNSARIALGAAASSVALDRTLNLSDLNSASAGRTNLGLGTLATQNGIFSGTSSGTNTGDQTFTLTGAITGSGTGSIVTSFGTGAITNANLANVPAFTIKGRNVSGTGAPSDLTASQAKVVLAITNSDVSGLGGAAVLNVGTIAGTVAAGNDSRFMPAGGVTGATLTKSSGVDYSVTWQAPQIFNVKTYGATGDGSTPDQSFINAAIAALPAAHAALYFPPGKYRITGGLTQLSGKSYLTIYGEGAEIYNDTGAAGGNIFVINSSSSNVEIYGLTFNGNSTVRGSGIGIRSYSSNTKLHNLTFLTGACSDFAIHVSNDAGGYTSNVLVADNIITGPLGDGVHVGNANNVLIENNKITSTGDDGIAAVADSASFPPFEVVIVGNQVVSPGGLASSVSGVGIRVAEAGDILIESNSISSPWENAIEVGRYTSTTAYNNRIHVVGNKCYNSTTHAGARGAIWLQFCNESSIEGNMIYDPASGAGICVLDFNDMTIRGNTVRGSPFRGIVCDDSTTANVAANWYGLIIDANIIQWNQANESIYAVPASGKTINNVIITSNVGNQLPGGNWIYYDRCTTGKVGNNTSRDGRSVAAGGSVSGITAFNNN